ncbi:N-terminal binuclear Zn cluster-containing/DNA binding domain-containing protein [Thelonectria olida]|uniref:N-terminal binuclear Zn cluster-containing/DNA binding domain-containing protein n=1 Tax=Thelonectria olida TaxID=1576542 RepID=A0A9P9AV07_9HYPO|nr:N-terminal binuclear Zn cluster-containing/DNA binding domain-containing protein [Thelonectria olida]
MPPSNPPSDAGEHSPSATLKRVRAKHACRECNARRVRCNVTEANPCSNCQSSGAKCEVLPSRRGRYPRKSRRKDQSTTTDTTGDHAGSSTPAIDPPADRHVSEDTLPARTPSPATDPAAPGSLFFGESNFLTLVPGRPQGEESNQIGDPNATKQKARLLFPITSTPQSIEGASTVSCDRVSSGTARYLCDEGALTLPDLHTYVPALHAYFDWFHPCFPILDRADFTRRLASHDVSYLLLQSMLFIGATYCDHDTIVSMGFKDRSEAKSLLYTRARLLFHADWEKDEITLIQSLFLMSFWRGGPSDVRDVRYWLGVVIGVAESYGLHRSARFTTRDSHRARLRRRIWWSIYVRERQAAASLGLPSRIRDDDCDIEPLSPSDLESEVAEASFGSCKPEHITYAIKMVEIARILGRVIDVQFLPGRPPSTAEQVKELDRLLEAWKQGLPDVEDGNASVWSHLLHLAYNHVRILIHRHSFLKQNKDDSGQIAVMAASRISRIAEDMLAQGTLRYGQMHLITSLFAALCIHAISIKRGVDVTRRIAEHRAQMCLLGLEEIKKYWRINNNVLDLFLQYLDVSIAKRLHGSQAREGSTTTHEARITSQVTTETPIDGDARYDFPTPQMQAQTKAFEDQYFNMLYGPWEGEDGLADLGLVFQADDPLQTESLNFLGRSL